MSFTDKAKNKVEELSGAAKERIGNMADNERMRGEGGSEQSSAHGRQAGEKIKDAGRKAKDTFTR
ncbi:CsbD family protein [Micromonospora sp. NPDC000442]|uniref:CsbD family protein n=1 Tax=Micromonospora sp. NPDC000442 TaxID=3364217 RepID=UPI00368A4A81